MIRVTKYLILTFLSAILVFSSACASSEQDRSNFNNTNISSAETTSSAKSEETDSANESESNTTEAPMLSIGYEPSSFASVEEYYASNQINPIPDCYILKNKPENAVLTGVTFNESSYVAVHYYVPLDEKYENKDLDQYSIERLTEVICERFLLGDGEASFKINVLDKIDQNGYEKLEINGKEYYYIPEINSFTGESALLGYEVEFLENGDYIFIHIPPFDSLEKMVEYLEVVKARN